MKLNNKGYSLAKVIIISVTLITIVIGITSITTNNKENIGTKKIGSLAVSDTISNVSDYMYNTGGISYTDEYLDFDDNLISPNGIKKGFSLDEDYKLSINLSENLFGNSDGKITLKVDDNTNSESFLGLDVNSLDKNISDYSFDNGLILNDTSYWTDIEQIENQKYQLDLLKEQKYNILSEFISSESRKLNKPGTFLIFDLGKPIHINNFSFNLFDNSEGIRKPKVIGLTFDNGTKYYFSLNYELDNPVFSFIDTKTRFVKIDYLIDNSGVSNLENSIITGISSLTNDDIVYSGENTDNLSISFPSVGTNNVKYYEIFFSENNIQPDNPTITVPQKSGNIEVYYDISNSSIKPKYLWVDTCGLNNICKKHGSSSLPKEIIY